MSETNIPKEYLDLYIKRTNNHIRLVKEFGKLLGKNFESHDEDKLIDPRDRPSIIRPYVWLTAKQNKGISVSSDTEKQIRKATFQHIKNNSHHPEYWDDKCDSVDFINSKDRNSPSENIVDATKMPMISLEEMISDFCAMSVELKSNPYDWCKKNFGVRWKFTPKQEEFCYATLDRIWKDEYLDGKSIL